MARILGISAFYHDSAAALVENGEIISAAQEERFNRKKHYDGFPAEAVRYCLSSNGISLSDLDAVVFYDKPLLKFERLLETYYAFAPKGIRSFLAGIPVWISEKIFLKQNLSRDLSALGTFDRKKVKILFTEHHLAHAASAFFPSPFDEAAILTIDGVGEWTTASISHGKGKTIKMLREMKFPHSVGLLYSAFTYYLGFTVNSGEYKLMGLAPYGDPDSHQTREFIGTIKKYLVDIKEDGSIWLNQDYFNYCTGLTMVQEKKWHDLFGFSLRKPESELEQKHCNLAYAIQNVTEEIVGKMAIEAKKLTGSDNLCMAGGVALNCVSNGRILKSDLFRNIFIQPASGDAGGAVGAALAASFTFFDEQRKTDGVNDGMKGAYLGPDFSPKEIQWMAKKFGARFTVFDRFDELCAKSAEILAEGNVLGWFQGRMEFGPRALGNRSILGDARNREMQKKLNLKIKYREGFRPFAPSVLIDDCQDYFDMPVPSPYMLLIGDIAAKRQIKVPEEYNQLPLWDKLYFVRSDLPSITHLDYSARIQTVSRETNPEYWQLINAFKEKTGYGVIVNTSFNVRGEPIVCTPEDAYRCFMRTEMDYLVIGNFMFRKTDQPDWENKERWMTKFRLD